MKSKLFLALLVLIITIGNANAATPAEITASVQKGTAWLALQQNADGSWNGDTATTALAVLKFEEYAKELGKSPFDPSYLYNTQVTDGLNFIFAHLDTTQISDQTYEDGVIGDPDSNGNGIGVYVASAFNGESNYYNGIVIMAISASNDPSRVVNVAGSPVNGQTYMQVAEDMVDYIAFGQVDTGSGRGAWDYWGTDSNNPTSERGDNSVSGWVTLGLGYANSNFGIATPGFVKTELNRYIDYIQNQPGGGDDWCSADPDGGSGYTDPACWVNTYKTGSLLYQMKMVGDTVATPRVMDAVDYIERHWNDANQDPGWRDGIGTSNYQATFSLLKGFDVFGITQIDVGGPLDWFDDMATEIINEQYADGHWQGSMWGNAVLDTVWALLTIEKAVTGPQPQCSDGIDNDGDGLIDMDDPGCENPQDNSEANGGPSIPEFPTIAMPVMAIIGLLFLLHRKK